MGQNVPLVNGFLYSFASIEAKLGGKRFIGFKEINYKSKRDRGKLHGAASQMLGRTRGKHTSDTSFALYRASWQEFIDFLMEGQTRFVGICDVFFEIVVTFAEEGAPTLTDELKNCTIDEIDCGNSDGTDPSMIKNSLTVQRILYNGKPDVGDIDLQGT